MRTDDLRTPQEVDVVFGCNSVSIAPRVKAAVEHACSEASVVIEAHLPTCFIPGVSVAPLATLVIVADKDSRIKPLVRLLTTRLHDVVPQNSFLDIWPIPCDHPAVLALRRADSCVYRRHDKS